MLFLVQKMSISRTWLSDESIDNVNVFYFSRKDAQYIDCMGYAFVCSYEPLGV